MIRSTILHSTYDTTPSSSSSSLSRPGNRNEGANNDALLLVNNDDASRCGVDDHRHRPLLRWPPCPRQRLRRRPAGRRRRNDDGDDVVVDDDDDDDDDPFLPRRHLARGRDAETRRASNDAYLATLQRRVERINDLESDIEELDDADILAKTSEFRMRLSGGESVDGPLLEEAFAVVREAAWRVIEQRHYDVQLLGGLVLHDGRLAEMATGEGKTLVSTLPCYVNALTGRASFVITVNDYLARRDMEKMGQVHRYLGLTVGLVQAGMTEDERRDAYSRDVVYVTNSELGFDYLRDHLALSPAQTVLPDGAFGGFCVVDEADSVLIDEARTPLIISKQVPAPSNKYRAANTLADNLRPKVHYDVDMKNKNVVLNERGYKDCERALGVDSLFEEPSDATGAWAPFVLNAVKAKELFNRDVEYTVLPDGKGVGIIDSFTGRVLDGRRWSDGLHQSIEAKEGIEVSEQSKVIAKVTYQVSEGVGRQQGGRGGGGRKTVFTSSPFCSIPLFFSRVHIRKRAIL